MAFAPMALDVEQVELALQLARVIEAQLLIREDRNQPLLHNLDTAKLLSPPIQFSRTVMVVPLGGTIKLNSSKLGLCMPSL